MTHQPGRQAWLEAHVTDRTCVDCGTDITGLHGKSIRCPACRIIKYPPPAGICRYRCGRPVKTDGLCQSCYQFDHKYGEGYALLAPEERFWREVNKDGPVPADRPELGPCWVWTGHRSAAGYGTIPLPGGWQQAPRFAYELLKGPIPGKRRVIQLCGLNACVNPDHLRAVAGAWTRREFPVVADHVTDLDLAYWGGLTDGEGSFSINPATNGKERITAYQSQFAMRMTDKPIIEAFAEAFGLTVSPRTYENDLSVLPLYVSETASINAAAVALALLPYLRVKKRQAELIIRLETEKREPGLRTQPSMEHLRQMADGRVIRRRATSYDQGHLDRWHGYYLEVRGLNRPGRDIAAPAQPEQGGTDAQDQVPVEPDLSLF
jgi:hypothetical protein